MDLLHLFLENTIAIEHLKNLPHQIKSKRDPTRLSNRHTPQVLMRLQQ